MRNIFFKKIAYCVITIVMFTSCKAQVPYTEEMKLNLKNMFKKDQDLQTWDAKRLEDSKYIDSMRIVLDKVNKENYNTIKDYYSKYSFPGIKENGKEASMDFWLIIQHCDFDVAFQEEVLKGMKKEYERNNVSPRNYAYLCDRVLKNKGLKQLYGTQISWDTGSPVPFPLQYPDKVDEMRKKMELEPLKEYLDSFLNNN